MKVEVLQTFYRANGRDSLSGEKSFMYGKSTANQVTDSKTKKPLLHEIQYT